MREESIFAGALEIATPEERATFLEDECTGDAELRGRVEALLRAHSQSGDLLDPPEGGLARSTHDDTDHTVSRSWTCGQSAELRDTMLREIKPLQNESFDR